MVASKSVEDFVFLLRLVLRHLVLQLFFETQLLTSIFFLNSRLPLEIQNDWRLFSNLGVLWREYLIRENQLRLRVEGEFN